MNQSIRSLTSHPFHHTRRCSTLWSVLFGSISFALLLTLLVTQSQTAMAAGTTLPPTFSLPHGHYSGVVTLTLSSATPGATIRFTTDYSTPSKSKGTIYTDTLTISTTTVIRAIAYVGSDESNTVTQSYIFLADVCNQARDNHNNDPAKAFALGPLWPRNFAASDASGPYPADYEMDPEIVDKYTCAKMQDVLKTLPTISLVSDTDNFWDPNHGIYYNPNEKSGDPQARPDPLNNKWERPIALEWINPPGVVAPDFSINGGARIHGQASRRPKRTPKKTLRIYFKAAYGATKLEYRLFEEFDAVTKFDRILLRNGGNRNWSYWDGSQRREADYVNDEWAREAWEDMGHITSHGTPAHLYLNGVYWGLYNISERIDEKFLASYAGGNELNFDAISANEDFDDAPDADAGDLVAYNQVLDLVGRIPITTPQPVLTEAQYQQLKQLVDLENLADYMILNHFIGKTDWPDHNWNAYRKRTGTDTRFKFVAWDNDSGFNKVNENTIIYVNSPEPGIPAGTIREDVDSPIHIFLRLATHPEFRLLLGDRLYRHVYNNGALATNQCIARYTLLSNLIDQAVIGESARWGDYTRDVFSWDNPSDPGKCCPAYLYTRDFTYLEADPGNIVTDTVQLNWLQVRDSKLNPVTGYCAQRPGIFVTQYMAFGWYDPSIRPPLYSQEGGSVPAGYNLGISHNNANLLGDIYYTLDGTDPRLEGGLISPNAIYGGDQANVTINTITRVKARTLQNGKWSVIHEITLHPPQNYSDIVINELYYSPLSVTGAEATCLRNAPSLIDPDEFEYIELYNKGLTPIRLDEAYAFEGFSFHFPYPATIVPGGYAVLAKDPDAFKCRFGFEPFGNYRGSLANLGERLSISSALGSLVDFVHYFNPLDVTWPPNDAINGALGTGNSLALKTPAPADNNIGSSWEVQDATPGQPNKSNKGNLAPQVSLTAPGNNTSFLSVTPVTVTAAATDVTNIDTPFGGIAQVQFFANGLPIANCTDTIAPYECSWSSNRPGNHLVSAVATDNSNTTTASKPVTVTILNQAPTVAITSPVAGASIPPLVPTIITANAIDLDGLVKQVVFFANGQPLNCVDTAAPFTCSWTPATSGEYGLSAQATDELTATGSSTVVSITVVNQLPTAAVSSPTNGAIVQTNAAINVVAQASDLDGAITQVIFFANDVQFCVDTTLPFACTWTPTTAGAYTIKVQATDNSGAHAVSTAVSVNVSDAPPPNQPPVASFSNPTNGANVATGLQIVVRVNASDPDGAVAIVTLFANNSAICQDTNAPFECPWTPATPGNYELKAVVDDGVGGLGNAIITVTALGDSPNPGTNITPTVSIISPINGFTFTVGSQVTIQATPFDADGTVTSVAFYANGSLIDGCLLTTAPYQCTFTPKNESTTVTVTVTDDRGATGTAGVVIGPVIRDPNPDPNPTPNPEPNVKKSYLPIITR